MPNRILRDWTDSEPVNVLSVHAERLFVRLIMKADDYGRLTANPKLLRAMLFPLTLEKVREADLQRWIAECERAGLVRLYGPESKPLLAIIRFNQQVRAKFSKYPAPPDEREGSAVRLLRDCSADDTHPRSETETESKTETQATPDRVRAWFEEFFALYPKKKNRDLAWAAFRGLDPDEATFAWIVAAVKRKAASEGWLAEDGRFVPKADEWLRERRWEEVKVEGVRKVVPKTPPPSPDVLREVEELHRRATAGLAPKGVHG